jgi:hypothetical protein
MKVRVEGNYENNTVDILFDFSEGEDDLIRAALPGSKTFASIMENIARVNDLGRAISEKYLDENEETIIGYDGIGFSKIDRKIITEDRMKEIAEAIGNTYAKILTQAIELPEIDETVAEIELPFEVKQKLVSIGYKNPVFKSRIKINKARGLNDVNVVVDTEASDYIEQYLSYIYAQFEYGDDMKIHIGNKPIPLVTYFKDVYTYYNKYVYSPDFDPDSGTDLKELIANEVNKIKEDVNREVQRIKESNLFNMLIARLGAYIFNGNGHIGKFKIKTRAGSMLVQIYRGFVLNPVYISINFYPNKNVDKNENMHFKVKIEDASNKISEYNMYEEKYIDNNYIIRSISWKYEGYIGEDLIKERYRRILQGDFSVIDEVYEEDAVLMKTIPEQLKKNPPYLVEDSDNKGVSIDILELIPEKQKQELITYLVAEKLKNS